MLKNFSGKIRGAIFDADGTLLNSMHIWHELGARYLKSLGLVPEKNLAAVLYPMSLEQSSAYLQKNYSIKNSVQEIRAGILKIIEDFYFHEVELKPGVKIFLEALNEKNIPMVIATSGDRELLNAALERNEIKKFFSGVFTCSELGTDKRDSKIFLICSEFLNLSPEVTAVFEDSFYAIATAKAAGFITFGVEDESNLNDREKISGLADFYIKSF